MNEGVHWDSFDCPAAGTDTAAVWRSARLCGMEMMHTRYGALAFSKHFHDTFVIQVIEEGVDEFECHGAPFHGRPGDIVVINPQIVHSGRPVGPGPLSYRSFYPTNAHFVQWLYGTASRPDSVLIFPSPLIRDRHCARLLLDCHRRVQSDPEDRASYNAVCDAFRTFARRHARWSPGRIIRGACDSRLFLVRNYLAECSASFVPLCELADLASMSPFHLNRRFREHFGLPPRQFQINIRIERARMLLRNGVKVAHAAETCGFADQAHLTRCFRRHVGMTPARYRNRKIVQDPTCTAP